MPTKLMSVDEWIAIPDNPIQRDTERHARKAKHLRTPIKTHWVCHACQLPDKTYVKLDGHTRALLWKRKEIPEPPTGFVDVHIFPVKTMEECTQLYKTYDSKEALETVTDKVAGALHSQNFAPQSALLRFGAITSTMKICWNIWKGRGPMNPGKTTAGEIVKDFDVYECIEEFLSELTTLDSFMLDHKSFPSGVVAAFILTNRKYGFPKVKNFWLGVFSNSGEKSGGKMDGVQAIAELMLMRKGRHATSTSVLELTARCVMACEKYLENETMSGIPKPFDLHGYIAHAKPQVRLIKHAKEEVEKGARV